MGDAYRESGWGRWNPGWSHFFHDRVCWWLPRLCQAFWSPTSTQTCYQQGYRHGRSGLFASWSLGDGKWYYVLQWERWGARHYKGEHANPEVSVSYPRMHSLPRFHTFISPFCFCRSGVEWWFWSVVSWWSSWVWWEKWRPFSPPSQSLSWVACWWLCLVSFLQLEFLIYRYTVSTLIRLLTGQSYFMTQIHLFFSRFSPVRKHEFVPEHLCLWLFHVLCPGHSQLDIKTPRSHFYRCKNIRTL